MAPPGGEQAAMPEMPKMPNMWPMLITMVVIFVLYGIDQWNMGGAVDFQGKSHNIGSILDVVFGPIIGFNGKVPVVTLMIAGTVMVLLSSILRTLLTDTLAQQKASAYSSAFNKELREARMSNNMYKVKKLTEMQGEVMAKSMETSGAMMKIMPWTMCIVVPMFLWVRFFVGVTLHDAGNLMIQVPWADVNLASNVWIMPAWILVYSMVSIPIGQFVSRIVRYYQFKKKLETTDYDAPAATDSFVPTSTVEPVKEETIVEQPPVASEPDKQEPPKEGL